MRFQELRRGSGRHLARDDAGQITLYGQLIDSHDLIGLYHDAKDAFKGLSLLTLPMEVYADGHILQRERGIRTLWTEGEMTIQSASPQDAAFRELHHLLACNLLALGYIGTVQRESDLLSAHDAYTDDRLSRDKR